MPKRSLRCPSPRVEPKRHRSEIVVAAVERLAARGHLFEVGWDLAPTGRSLTRPGLHARPPRPPKKLAMCVGRLGV